MNSTTPVQPVSDRDLRAAASMVRPSARQLAWQQRDLSAFIHFGINTFTDLEWGTGTEDPTLFNPAALDASQWVEHLAAAGFKAVILTAKHHDGFCLWPTRYTRHSVASSPWRSGSGDVVGELVAAARQHGLAVGLYLSPADLHQIHIDRRYGNGSAPAWCTIPTLVEDDDRAGRVAGGELPSFDVIADDYNRFYLNQLYEVLTDYGPIDEIWLDGANPDSSHPQTYDRAAWYQLIRALAPDAVIFGGPDARWVGNEVGIARTTEWSVVPFTGDPEGTGELALDHQAVDLGSVESLRRGVRCHWYPAESDVSIRPGWFYHASQDNSVKSSQQLLELYEHSVGRNTVFLLNVPPNRDGLLAAPDVDSIRGFGERLARVYGDDLASRAHSWHQRDSSTTLGFSADQSFNLVVLREDIANGQQVEQFDVYADINGTLTTIASGTTIGHCRILRLPSIIEARRVEVRVTSARGPHQLAVSLHRDHDAAGPIVFPTLEAAFDAVTVTNDNDPRRGELGPQRLSLSAQTLTDAGITPGAAVNALGFTFRWPAVSPGAPDAVRPNGQRISLSGRAARVGLLLVASEPFTDGYGMLTYDDGNVEEFRLPSVSPWGTARQDGAPVIELPYHNTQTGPSDTPAWIDAIAVPADASRTLTELVLPTISVPHAGPPGVHLLAIALDSADAATDGFSQTG
ncbi:alpha-L-fucosidase [Streptomyces bobili]|uniref:alpha-L-fucosidase n=1 Tax=Streptomyces bobili TaxID=67280 RepID=UPI00342699D6